MLLAEGRVEGENTDRDRLAKQEAGGVGAMSINILKSNPAAHRNFRVGLCARIVTLCTQVSCSIGHCTSVGSK